METLLLNKNQTDIAANILKSGGTVTLPTETVYGLFANAFDELAVSKIFKAKGRPSDNPLIVHISDFDMIYKLVKSIPPLAKKLTDKFWPGPLTVILPSKNTVPKIVTANLDSIAIRLPSNDIIKDVINIAQLPLAGPSANISGKPSPTKFSHVFHDMNGKVNAILDGGSCSVGLESTVISFTEDIPHLLRPGGITVEQIEDTIGKIVVDKAVTNSVSPEQKVISPGMKYKHYAPNAKIIILDGTTEQYINYVNKNKSPFVAALCYESDVNQVHVKTFPYGKQDDYNDLANELFSALRKIDSDDTIKTVYARCPSASGVGLAVYNRLIRAAGFEVLKLD